MTRRTRLQPRPLSPAQQRASAAWEPPYQYWCTGGNHSLGADEPVERCPAFVLGVPCTGELVRFGPGSRKGVA